MLYVGRLVGVGLPEERGHANDAQKPPMEVEPIFVAIVSYW
jgi:hypothetical protein